VAGCLQWYPIARNPAWFESNTTHPTSKPWDGRVSLTSQVVRFYKYAICPLCETK
jgi:hypothetical protein